MASGKKAWKCSNQSRVIAENSGHWLARQGMTSRRIATRNLFPFCSLVNGVEEAIRQGSGLTRAGFRRCSLASLTAKHLLVPRRTRGCPGPCSLFFFIIDSHRKNVSTAGWPARLAMVRGLPGGHSEAPGDGAVIPDQGGRDGYCLYLLQERRSGDSQFARSPARTKRHKIRFDQELFIGAAWREQLMGAILASDVVLVLWTENTHRPQFIPAEIGVVRASPQIGLLPVMIGDVPIPPFIQDLMVERIPDAAPETLRKLADKLDASIRKYIEYRNLRKTGRPKVFISHRHKDEEIVRALVE